MAGKTNTGGTCCGWGIWKEMYTPKRRYDSHLLCKIDILTGAVSPPRYKCNEIYICQSMIDMGAIWYPFYGGWRLFIKL